MTDHDDAIEWPNHKGFTPCTSEYARVVDELDAIKPAGVRLDDLTADDYQLWHELDSKRCQMQMAGHLGKPVRYSP